MGVGAGLLNPATTLAFALRRDMGWIMAVVYWIVQFTAAACGSLLARAFFGPAGNLAATVPKPGASWPAASFEAIITFGLVLMILNLANGPKLMCQSQLPRPAVDHEPCLRLDDTRRSRGSI